MNEKEILSFVAVALAFAGFYPYIRSILKGSTKPHVFSWVIWGLTTLIVFFAQIAGKGGVGAWSTGVSALITFYVAYLALIRRADARIAKVDWVYFLVALIAIPIWYLTSNPLWAVIILTSIDVLGSLPTLRKILHNPFSENALFYSIMGVRSTVSIFALEYYSWTTILFPAVLSVMCVFFVWILLMGRRKAEENMSRRAAALGG